MKAYKSSTSPESIKIYLLYWLLSYPLEYVLYLIQQQQLKLFYG